MIKTILLASTALLAATFAFTGARANEAVANGGFLTGDLADWTTFTTANGSLGFAPDPQVTSFDVTGGGAQNAGEFQVGEVNFTTLREGGGLRQTITADAGPLFFSADIAAYDKPAFTNSDGGIFSVYLDGTLEDSVNFGQINGGQTLRDTLSFSEAVTAGQHDLEILMTRPERNANGVDIGQPQLLYTPYQYVTDVSALQGTPTSPSNPLLSPTNSFTFVTSQGTVTYIDPAAATGYDYLLDPSSPLIDTAVFPTVPGDTDGYDVYALTDPTTPLFSNVLGGTTVDFTALPGYGAGIDGFELRGIDLGAGLDPSDPAAFVTGLSFAGTGVVKISQVPIVTNTPPPPSVPEPSTWTMMILGIGLVGLAMRRRTLAAA